MVNAPLICLILDRLQSMMVGRESSIQTKKMLLLFLGTIITATDVIVIRRQEFITVSLLAVATQSAVEIDIVHCL